MRKNVLKSSALVGVMSLLLLPNFRFGSLKEITKPYLGVYECVEAKLGEKDYLGYFEEICLELKSDGSFTLCYCEKNGEKKKEIGKYKYDPKKKTVTLIGGAGDFIKREFSLSAGVLTVTVRVGDKILNLQFEQK